MMSDTLDATLAARTKEKWRISRSAATATRRRRDRLKGQPQERSLIAGSASTPFLSLADSLFLPVTSFSSWSESSPPHHGFGRCGSQCQQRNPLQRDGCIAPGGFAAARPGKGQDYRRATDFVGFTFVFMRLRPVRRPSIERMHRPPTCGA